MLCQYHHGHHQCCLLEGELEMEVCQFWSLLSSFSSSPTCCSKPGRSELQYNGGIRVVLSGHSHNSWKVFYFIHGKELLRPADWRAGELIVIYFGKSSKFCLIPITLSLGSVQRKLGSSEKRLLSRRRTSRCAWPDIEAGRSIKELSLEMLTFVSQFFLVGREAWILAKLVPEVQPF